MPLANQYPCPLCNSDEVSHFHTEGNGHKRVFLKCGNCELVFADPDNLLAKSTEKSRYEHHNNSRRTKGYEKFLRTLIDPVKDLVSKSSVGLDFGCGPYPMLVEIFKEDGYQIEGYDPYFCHEKQLLEKTYDFVTCCEVVEHFNRPIESFEQLCSVLKTNSILGIKTTLFKDEIDFSKWYYKNDDTHVSFYTQKSIEWIANNFGLKILKIEDALIIFQKIS